MNDILITKTWAMPNGRTFSIKPIQEFVRDACEHKTVIVDPFANEAKYGTITNDLNEEYDTTYHMDGLAFLESLGDETADVVLYDPPYSITQASQLYKAYGKEKLEVNVANMKYWKLCKDNCARILRRGGYVCLSGGTLTDLVKGAGLK